MPSLDWPFNLEEEAFDGPFGAQLRKRVLHSALSVEYLLCTKLIIKIILNFCLFIYLTTINLILDKNSSYH